MTNRVSIVVTGQNKFKPTSDSIVKSLKEIRTVTDVATKAAAKLDAQLTAPKTAEVNKVAAALDKAGAAADRMTGSLDKTAKKTSVVVAETEKLNKEAAKPKTEATDKVTKSLNEASAAADSLIARMRRVGTETTTTTKLPLGLMFRDAVQESTAALDELVLLLYKTGVDMGDALSRGLRLDVVRAKFAAVGNTIGTVLDRALDPVRRLRAAGVTAADDVGEAWENTTNLIQDALAAAARAAVAIGAAAMVPVRQVRLFAVETADAVGSAWGRAVDRVQAKSRSVGDAVASIWERAFDRVQTKARETSQVIVYGYDRAMIPARRAGSVVVAAAEKVERAWSLATAPVIRFGRAVGDVTVQTAQLTGRIVGPFAKVGAALAGVLGDAGIRGGQAVVRGVGSALGSGASVIGKGAAGLSRGVATAFDKAGDVGSSALRMGNRAVDGITKAFSAIGNVLPKALTNPAVMVPLLAAGSFVGAAAGGAVVLGLGAGLAGAGIASAAGADRVKLAWKDLGNDLGKEMRTLSAPFQDTLIDIEGQARRSFGIMAPALRGAFAEMAPDVSKFFGRLFSSFDGSSIRPIQRAFSAILDDLGPRMPRVIDGISDSLVSLSGSIERNPKALGQLVSALGSLVEVGVGGLEFFNQKVGEVDRGLQLLGNWLTGKGFKLDIEVASNISGGERAADVVDRVNAAFGRMGGSSYDARSGVESVDSILLELADTELSVADRGGKMLELLDRLAGRSVTYEDGMQGISDTVRDLGTMFDSAAERAAGFGDALINPDNTVSTMTANGSKLQDMMQGLQQDFANTAAGVRELEDAGMSHDDAVNKVNHDLNVQRDRLLATAEGMGLTRQQMEGLLAAYGLKPDFLDTVVRLDENGVPQKINSMARDRYINFIAQFSSGTGYGARPGPEYAHGGVSSGGWTTVGELGPERVKLPPGAQVQPYTASRRQLEPSGVGGGMGGGGSWAPTLNLAGMPPAGTGRQFIDWLTGELRRQGVKLVRA